MATGADRLRTLYADGLEATTTLPASDLEATGRFAVTQVRTAEAATNALDTGEFDCVVTSTALADGDYATLVETARERTPSIPVVVIADDSVAKSVGSLGAEDGVVLVEPASKTGDRSTVHRVVASQLERVVDRHRVPGQSLAGIPAPAFAYAERFVDWNDAFLELIGVDEATLATYSLADVFDCAASDLSSAAADGDSLDVEPAGGTDDGHGYSIDVGRENGRYVCLVSEQPTVEAAEADAFAAGAMLESLLEGIPLAMYFKDEQSRHVAVSNYQVGTGHEWFIENPEGKIHHTPEDVVGKTDFDLYSPADAERGVATDREVMESEEPRIEQTRLFTVQSGDDASLSSVKDLAMRTLKAPWYDEGGEIVGVVGATIDVTEHWETERRLEVSDAILDTITAIVQQELRSDGPTAAADRSRAFHEPDPERLHRISADVETLLRTRDQPASTELVDLAHVAEDAWATVDRGDAELNIEASSVVDANPEQLQTLLRELFENATRHGGSAISIELGELDDGFYVADDGPGIDPDRRPSVFEYGTTSDPDGVGGGLALVDVIALAHGWSTAIEVSSDEGARVVVSDVRFH